MAGRTWEGGGAYRYGMNTQEKSPEIGDGHYTAQFWEYDSGLARRWELDPKPNVSISGYAVFGGNPIISTDFYGDSLFTDNTKSANDDIMSSVKQKNRDYVKINATGTVSLDFGKASKEEIQKALDEDKGLSLLNDLCTKTKDNGQAYRFLYQSGPGGFGRWIDPATPDKIIEGPTRWPEHKVGDIESGPTKRPFFRNASFTTYGVDSRGVIQRTLTPKDGFDGQVSIAPGQVTLYRRPTFPYTYEDGEFVDTRVGVALDIRADMVRHELMENFHRVVNKMSYLEAHAKAIVLVKRLGSDFHKFTWGE